MSTEDRQAPQLLVLAQTPYSLDEVRLGVDLDSVAGENARAALDFCREWLSGAASFGVHTSGSTGPAKPITLSRRQMQASARATGQALGLRAGMTGLVSLPTRYIAGKMMLVRGLELGLHLVVVEPASDPFAELPEGAAIDFAAFIPLQMQSVLVGPPRYRTVLDRMHAILIGGGPVSAALEATLQDIAAPVYHTYGMTETATHVALRRLNGLTRSECFIPLPGVACRVDERGCLAVACPMSNDEWLQTNDMVELFADGSFVWRGRWDNVINSGGVKVQVEQVEAQLERLLPVLLGGACPRFFVAGLPDERLGQVVTLMLESDPLDDQTTKRVIVGLRQALGPFDAPRRVVTIARFAETPTRKIDRQATMGG
jgi:O-succinylbenzoic acid--CoA ligase